MEESEQNPTVATIEESEEPSVQPEDPVEVNQEITAEPVETTEQQQQQETEKQVEPKKPEPIENNPIEKEKTVSITPEQKSKMFHSAKAYLMGQTAGQNLYSHLTNVLLRLLETRPENPVDIFDQISNQLRTNENLLNSEAREVEPKNVSKTAVKVKTLFEPSIVAGDIPDIMDLANLFEWAGVGFGKEETFAIYLSIKKLVSEKQLKSVRFFGKIFGLEKDYYIVEAERADTDKDLQEPSNPSAAGEEQEAKAIKKEKIPREIGTGVNRYIYWVTSSPEDSWKRLPDATPESIQTSRLVRLNFTGNLDNPIVSYPPFQGNESLLLRCQIARISAATVVSPAGYYKFDEESEGETVAAVVLNTDFEWPLSETLFQPDNWVHHIPYILPQGRTTFVSTKKRRNEEGEVDENEESAQEEEVESGPAILTPISEDKELSGDVPAWSIRSSSLHSQPKYSPVYLRSNRWPGAVTVGYNDKFANIYVGNGLKELGRPFAPARLPPEQTEFINVEKKEDDFGDLKEFDLLQEQFDPTVEQEEKEEELKKETSEALAEAGDEEATDQ